MKNKSDSDLQKRIPAAISAVLILLSVLCWPVFLSSLREKSERLELLKAEAEKLMEKRIYVDAAAVLEEAILLDGTDYGICLQLAECYRNLDDIGKFRRACDDAIARDPKRETAYLMKAEQYRETGKIAEAYQTAELARSLGCTSEVFDEMIAELDRVFVKTFLAADSFLGWHRCGQSDYAVMGRNGLSGIMDGSGEYAVEVKYERIGMLNPDGTLFPGDSDGVICLMDLKGRRRAVPDTGLSFVGAPSGSLIPVANGGNYAFADLKFGIRLDGFDECGAFCDGVAAFRKGGKWGLIGEDLVSVTSASFEEIALDAYGFCCAFGRISVRKDGKAYLADREGNLLSGPADAVAPAASEDGLIAFCADGLWGFLDREGNVAIAPVYEGAQSFSMGFAPVCSGGMWYYVDSDGNRVGEETYEEASPFSNRGRAVVKIDQTMYLLKIGRLQ